MNNIKQKIIDLNSQGLTDLEIAKKIGIYDCVGNYFDSPILCYEDYCEQCWLNKVEDILDNEHLNKIGYNL